MPRAGRFWPPSLRGPLPRKEKRETQNRGDRRLRGLGASRPTARARSHGIGPDCFHSSNQHHGHPSWCGDPARNPSRARTAAPAQVAAQRAPLLLPIAFAFVGFRSRRPCTLFAFRSPIALMHPRTRVGQGRSCMFKDPRNRVGWVSGLGPWVDCGRIGRLVPGPSGVVEPRENAANNSCVRCLQIARESRRPARISFSLGDPVRALCTMGRCATTSI